MVINYGSCAVRFSVVDDYERNYEYRVDVEGYNYTQEDIPGEEFDRIITLNQYTGNNTNVVTPILETEQDILLTVNPDPSDAILTLECVDANIPQVGNTISVPEYTIVKYTISKSGYNTRSGTITVFNSNITRSISLDDSLDFGSVAMPADEEGLDCGSINDAVYEIIDLGSI